MTTETERTYLKQAEYFSAVARETDMPAHAAWAATKAAWARERLARYQRNATARERAAILREVCGTSARAAREDMGL